MLPVMTQKDPIPALAMRDGQAMDLHVKVSIRYCTYRYLPAFDISLLDTNLDRKSFDIMPNFPHF